MKENLSHRPINIVDNEYTLLETTDLVFIDPVSTGYSRAVPKEKPEQFHNVKKDIESVGDFIRYGPRAANAGHLPNS